MQTDKRREYVNKTKRNIGSRFGYLKRMAKMRSLSFNISKEHYAFLVSSGCFYCSKQTLGVEMGGGLDRINNAKGYTEDNVLPCCGFCNKARGIFWSVEEFKLIRETIADFRGEDDTELTYEKEIIGEI